MISSEIITKEESDKLKEQLEDIFAQPQYNDELVKQFLKDSSVRKPPLIFLTYEEKLNYLKIIVKKGDPQYLKIFSGNNIGLRYFTSTDLNNIIRQDMIDKNKKMFDDYKLVIDESDVSLPIIKEIVRNTKVYHGASFRYLSHHNSPDKDTRNTHYKDIGERQNFWANYICRHEMYHNPPISFLEFIYIPNSLISRNPIKEEYIKQMIEIGAHINFISDNDVYHNYMTPLAAVSLESKYKPSTLKLLLDYGADPNIRYEKDGKTSSVFYNDRYGHITNTKKIDMLLIAGANPSQAELDGNEILKARYEEYKKDGFKSERLRQNMLTAGLIILCISLLLLSYKYTSLGGRLKEFIGKLAKIAFSKPRGNIEVDMRIIAKSSEIIR